MTDREKLIDLLESVEVHQRLYPEQFVDMLIANGVTVPVRCNKCKWYKTDSVTCGFWPDEGYRDPDHYCGEGEEKE